MESKIDREEPGFGQEFKTPQKSCQQTARNKSTTANLPSKDFNESVSFEKLLQRHSMAVKYCCTNLNDLLGSDLKLRSPSEMLKLASNTPIRDRKACLNDSYDIFDSEARYRREGLLFELSLQRDNNPNFDDGFFCDGFLSRPLNLDLTHIHERSDPYEDFYQYRQNGWTRGDNLDLDSNELCGGDEYRKRKRKNNIQLKILKSEFSKNDNWNKEKITHVAQLTGLSESQVYKWCWDQKKKIEEQENQKLQNGGKVKADFNKYDLMELFKSEDFELALSQIETSNLSKRKPEPFRQPFRHQSDGR